MPSEKHTHTHKHATKCKKKRNAHCERSNEKETIKTTIWISSLAFAAQSHKIQLDFYRWLQNLGNAQCTLVFSFWNELQSA